MKKVATIFILFFVLLQKTKGQQKQFEEGNFAVRLSGGIANFDDEKIHDQFEYKFAYSIGCFAIIKKGLIDYNMGASFENKGAFNDRTHRNMNLNYLVLSFLPSLHYANINSRVFLGPYGGAILNNTYRSYQQYPYIFKNFDAGGIVGYEYVFFPADALALGIDVRFQYSFLDIYGNGKNGGAIPLSSWDSKWTRNLGVSAGLNFRFR